MRRVAWFRVVIDTEDEATAMAFVSSVNAALDRFAREAVKVCSGKVQIVEPMEAGQSFGIHEQQPMRREDV